jgi:hypothetical protein
MVATSEMPQYQCYKKVHALKIAKWNVYGECANFWLEGGRSASHPKEMVARYEPKIGDYYVIYDDGYASVSPAAAFEAGYTLISAPVAE